MNRDFVYGFKQTTPLNDRSNAVFLTPYLYALARCGSVSINRWHFYGAVRCGFLSEIYKTNLRRCRCSHVVGPTVRFGTCCFVSYTVRFGAVFRNRLTLLRLKSRFGGKLLEIRVNCPQNGTTAVLKGLTYGATRFCGFPIAQNLVRCRAVRPVRKNRTVKKKPKNSGVSQRIHRNFWPPRDPCGMRNSENDDTRKRSEKARQCNAMATYWIRKTQHAVSRQQTIFN